MATLQGHLCEQIFSVECVKRNIPIYKPIADLYGCDFIVGSKRLIRIQVKSTRQKDPRYKGKDKSYKICVRHGAKSKAYKNQFDFMAVYLMPESIFYMIPIYMLNKTTIRINPNSNKCKFRDFKERWDLIQG